MSTLTNQGELMKNHEWEKSESGNYDKCHCGYIRQRAVAGDAPVRRYRNLDGKWYNSHIESMCEGCLTDTEGV